MRKILIFLGLLFVMLSNIYAQKGRQAIGFGLSYGTEIESIGDSCYNLARTINRKRQTNQDFTEKQYEHIHFMMKLTNDALAQMIVVVEKPEHQSIDINKSFNIENEINNYRNQLKNQNILDVNNKEYDYQMGVYYMDIIAECEKLGDYVVNVVEASSDVKEKKAS
mgnify:FL=1